MKYPKWDFYKETRSRFVVHVEKGTEGICVT